MSLLLKTSGRGLGDDGAWGGDELIAAWWSDAGPWADISAVLNFTEFLSVSDKRLSDSGECPAVAGAAWPFGLMCLSLFCRNGFCFDSGTTRLVELLVRLIFGDGL